MADDATDLLEAPLQDSPVEAIAAPETAEPAFSPPPAPQAAYDFRGGLAEHGITLPEGVDEKAALAHFITLARKAEDAERRAAHNAHYATQYQQLAPKLNDFQKWEQEQARRAQLANEQPKPDPWGKPEIDPATLDLYQKGLIVKDPQSGRFVVDPRYASHVSPQAVDQFNKYAAWRQQKNQALIDDPKGTLLPLLQEDFQKQIDERATAIAQNLYQKLQREQWERDNFDWLYTRAADGSISPSQNQLLVQQEAQRLHGMGVPGNAALSLAIENVTRHLQLQQFAQPQPAAPPAKPEGGGQFNDIVKRQAMHNPNGSGRDVTPASNSATTRAEYESFWTGILGNAN